MTNRNGIFTVRCQFGETVVGACWWWLRSPGNNSRNAAYVYSGGYVDYYGNVVDYDISSVRPVVVVLP